MRIFDAQRLAAAAMMALLAACSSSIGDTRLERIACARGGAALAADCTVERSTSPAGPILTLRAPDGGFRRLLVTRDGRGVIAADGAVPAVVTLAGPGLIDVAIGSDRYRLPATIRPRR